MPARGRDSHWRDEWHLQNLRDNPALLGRLRNMLLNEREEVRVFAKQRLEEYDAWLKVKGFVPPEEDGRYGS